MDVGEFLKQCDGNIEIFDSILKTDNKLKFCRKAVASISGGSDSDLILDLCSKLDKEKKITYVFFDTGLEYQATKNHLKALEEKYSIKIEVQKAIKPIPTCCKQYGVPFLSKFVSECISRLQKHNFQWEDEPFEILLKKYPKCKMALRWWCNDWGERSRFNISWNRGLKEFMIANPPEFKISNKCCHYAKKLVVKKYIAANDFDLNITGIRKAEGGARASAYKNCFTPAKDSVPAHYRPLFFYKEETKRAYEKTFDVHHNECYTKWGMKRTGCAGCPYGKDFETELAMVQQHEPKMFNALNNIFGKSYEYTRKYIVFVKNNK